MFAFDWTLKDISNLKNNPCKYSYLLTIIYPQLFGRKRYLFLPAFIISIITPIDYYILTMMSIFIENELANSHLIFWFYVCSQYFPFASIELSIQPVDDLVDHILEKHIRTFKLK